MIHVDKPNEPERPAEGWKYPYVAGTVDFGSNLKVVIQKASDRKVGYAIIPSLTITSSNQAPIGFLDEFCEQHDINPNLRTDKGSYVLELSKRDDLQKFLRLVRPYVIARHAESEVLLKNLLSGLDLGKASSKEGFYELMGYVDEIRAETQSGSGVKYDQAYFRDEWRVYQ